MGKRWITIYALITIFMLAGCSAKLGPDTNLSVTLAPDASLTGKPGDSITGGTSLAPMTPSAPFSPNPIRTKIPTPFPSTEIACAPLESGSYNIAYLREVSGQIELVCADPGGPGKRVVQLPASIEGDASLSGLSPDGKYFAYHTVEIGLEGSDFTLHILRLGDKSEVVAIPVITKDFKKGMAVLGEILANDLPESLLDVYSNGSQVSAEQITMDGMAAAQAGIWSMEWSPDSGQLAFAAQIHGPTTDLYVYNVGTGKLRQLSSGPTQIQFVDWSPDGQWIAHGSAFWVGMGDYMIFNFASQDGREVFSIETSANTSYGWYGPETFVISDAANGPGRFGLESVSMETQTTDLLWRYPYGSYVLDISIGKLLVFAYEFFTDLEGNLIGPEAGIYLVDIYAGSVEEVEGLDPIRIAPWQQPGEFALLEIDNDIYAMDNEGKMRVLVEDASLAGPASPDGNLLLYSVNMVESIHLFHVMTDEVMEVSNADASCIHWKPDSSGFIYKDQGRLYFNDLSGEASILVDGNTIDSGWTCETRWISGS